MWSSQYLPLYRYIYTHSALSLTATIVSGVTGPGRYECVCSDGYQRLGRSCVEVYREDQPSSSEQQWILSDSIDGVDWEDMVGEGEFVYFPGLDSPGGDYLLVETERDLERLCRNTQHCLAYNTNGLLKHTLLPPQQWIRWSDRPQKGLYVLDIDYCQLALERCPAHSQCSRNGPGNYSCQCVSPYQPSLSGDCLLPQTPQEKVRIQLSVRTTEPLSPDLSHSISGPAPSPWPANPAPVTMATHLKHREAEGVHCGS